MSDRLRRLVHLHWPTVALLVGAVLGWGQLRERIEELEARYTGDQATPQPPTMHPTGGGDVGANAHASDSAQPTCEGTVGIMQLQEAVGRHGPSILACQEHAPPAGGLLTLTIRLAADGQILAADATGPVAAHAAVRGCVEEALRGWTFPAPRVTQGGCAMVTLPFHFGAAAAASDTEPNEGP